MKLVPGLYETLLNEGLTAVVCDLEAKETEPLAEERAPPVLARYLHDALLKALRSLPSKDKLARQIALTNEVVGLLAESEESGIGDEERVPSVAEVLLAIRREADVKLGTGHLVRPSLPLAHSDLLVNGPRDLRIGSELRKELASADRVDVIVSFVRWSGLRIIERELTDFTARRPGCLRVLTTTYMGASEAETVEKLLELGAQVKVSYDDRRTRLHAKAWLFHRDSGFSTALIGSSNLSHAALLEGCEWNVRLSNVDNRLVLEKFLATFQQYWEDPQFEPYERSRFRDAARRRDPARDALARAVALRPYPHQETVLEALAQERAHGHTRNLVVAATGTGKTVVAALDYARLHRTHPTLLFVAHRQEILDQSLATFRAAMRDGSFGELLVGPHRPIDGKHVFASIQSLHEQRLAKLAPDAYDVVVVDEFHHAAAKSYASLLEHLRPRVLLGLTATPERADGRSVLGWFDGRVAAELRLWDALDLGLVSPFQYFGVHDGTDLSTVDFSAGRYDTATLERLYTADHVRANAVLRALHEKVQDPTKMKALGFCVSVAHAEFMARFFTSKGLQSTVVHGESTEQERSAALQALRSGAVNVVFARDLLNEGIDVPAVDAVLFLRPTESAALFLQQLGRGLRLEDGKPCLTVLDFIGDAHRRFRFVDRFRALVPGTRASVARAIVDGFPHLPAGCDIRLDRESQRAVLANIKAALSSSWRAMAEDLAHLGNVRLRAFLSAADLELEDLYARAERSFLQLRHDAGLRPGDPPDFAAVRALPRMLHIDDDSRLEVWRTWLRARTPPVVDANDPMQLMLFAVLGFVRSPVADMQQAFDAVWANADVREELGDILELLADRSRRETFALVGLPFRVHATYSRDEISAGLLLVGDKGKLTRTQGGVLECKQPRVRADVLYVEIDKDPKHYTPTTLYDDYAISPTHFHWESQSTTRAESRTGRRYQAQRAFVVDGWRTLLFVRRAGEDARGLTSPYVLLGPVRYLSHESEKPMKIVWELERPMPASFFADIKIAAG